MQVLREYNEQIKQKMMGAYIIYTKMYYNLRYIQYTEASIKFFKTLWKQHRVLKPPSEWDLHKPNPAQALKSRPS